MNPLRTLAETFGCGFAGAVLEEVEMAARQLIEEIMLAQSATAMPL